MCLSKQFNLHFGLFQVTLRCPMMVDSVWCVLDPYYSIRTLMASLGVFPAGEDVKGED